MSTIMYALPQDFDLQRLVGGTLYEFAFNANQIRFMFDSGIKIVVEGRMGIAKAAMGDALSDSALSITPQSPDIRLLSLIESQVTSVRMDEQRMNLTLTFANGQTLVLIGEDPYECYIIHIDDKEFIV